MDATATTGYYRCYSSTTQCYCSATVGPPEFADEEVVETIGYALTQKRSNQDNLYQASQEEYHRR